MLTGAVIQTMEQEIPDRQALDRLLISIAHGEQEALGELYSRTRGAVYGMSLSILKNAHDAQDVTQDTFVRIWESAEQYKSSGSPMAWILTVARNLALMRLRQSSRIGELTEEEWDAIPANAPAVTAEDRDILQTALAALKDTERQVVLLHAASGLKFREIAALLEMPVSTVLSKYHRAIQKMHAHLKGVETL